MSSPGVGSTLTLLSPYASGCQWSTQRVRLVRAEVLSNLVYLDLTIRTEVDGVVALAVDERRAEKILAPLGIFDNQWVLELAGEQA